MAKASSRPGPALLSSLHWLRITLAQTLGIGCSSQLGSWLPQALARQTSCQESSCAVLPSALGCAPLVPGQLIIPAPSCPPSQSMRALRAEGQCPEAYCTNSRYFYQGEAVGMSGIMAAVGFPCPDNSTFLQHLTHPWRVLCLFWAALPSPSTLLLYLIGFLGD